MDGPALFTELIGFMHFTVFFCICFLLFYDFLLVPSSCFYCYEVISFKQTKVSCTQTLHANWVALSAATINHFLNLGTQFSYSYYWTAHGSNTKKLHPGLLDSVLFYSGFRILFLTNIIDKRNYFFQRRTNIIEGKEKGNMYLLFLQLLDATQSLFWILYNFS